METLAQEELRLEAEFGHMQGLVEDLKDKYKDELNKHTETENEVFLIRKDMDEAYMNKIELESHLEGLINEINFYRPLYDEETGELQAQISQTSMVLCMDNSCSLGLDSIIAKVKAQYEESQSQPAEAETRHQIKYKELQMLVGKHGDDLHHTKVEVMNTRTSAKSRLRLRASKARGLP